MAEETGAQQFAFMLRGAGEGLSGQRVLGALREAGLGLRRQQFYRLWAQAQEVSRASATAAMAPPDQVPDAASFPPTPTRGATGVLQSVRLQYVERVTGQVRTLHYQVKGEAARTPQQVVNAAVGAYEGHAERYQVRLFAATYTGGVRLVPSVPEL